MRDITHIAVHCTATPQTTKIEDIQNYWRKNLGWKSPGYHAIVKPNGEVVWLLGLDQVSNGVKGWNSKLVNISYIGGGDEKEKPLDNRTPAQKSALLTVLKDLKKKFPKAIILGHRDFPKVAKACPCFNAKEEYANL